MEAWSKPVRMSVRADAARQSRWARASVRSAASWPQTTPMATGLPMPMTTEGPSSGWVGRGGERRSAGRQNSDQAMSSGGISEGTA